MSTWKSHIDGISTKLNKENAIHSEIRDFVDQETFKAIYQAIFESHLHYSSLVWTQNVNSTESLFLLQKKAEDLNFMNLPNHLIAGLDFPQMFILTTQAGPIWAVLMYFLTELNYMEEILFVLVRFLLGIIFKIFIEIFYFIS